MTSAENPDAGQGAVLLDIGGDIGAIVVTMPARMDGVEVEIRAVGVGGSDPSGHPRGDGRPHGEGHHHGEGQPRHGNQHRPHVAVVPRPTPKGIVHSLVYGEVTAGTYVLCPIPDGAPTLEVTVVGGEVSESDWPLGA